MSYCRWSSDDFQCDVYAYEHVHGGFMVHVASNRVVFKSPLPDFVPFGPGRIGEFIARQQTVLAMVDSAECVKIGLPQDGANYWEPDAGACADRLERLRGAGYNVPQYAIDALRAESTLGAQS